MTSRLQQPLTAIASETQMHPGAEPSSNWCTAVTRDAPPRPQPESQKDVAPHVVRHPGRATRGSSSAKRAYVERLAYTRTQAAERSASAAPHSADACCRSSRRSKPVGMRLIPVDELERFLAERRRKAQRAHATPGRPGRKAVLPAEVVARIRDEYAQREEPRRDRARAERRPRVRTAQGGRQWWPSTVRAVLIRQGRAGPGERR